MPIPSSIFLRRRTGSRRCQRDRVGHPAVRPMKKWPWRLAERLAVKHNLTGSRDAYLQADGSYVNRVIETGRGIPISLSVIYMAVANQAGLGLHGVAAPGHFMTRYEAVDGPLFIDAFANGEVLNLDQMLLRVSLTTGFSEERARTGAGTRLPSHDYHPHAEQPEGAVLAAGELERRLESPAPADRPAAQFLRRAARMGLLSGKSQSPRLRGGHPGDLPQIGLQKGKLPRLNSRLLKHAGSCRNGIECR